MEHLKILIVDDELPVRQELAAFPWEKVECSLVGEARNGKEALQMCAEKKPDIVFCDIEMPIMGGLDFTAALQKQYPNIQVIILSGHENFDYIKTALRLEVLDYIVKFEMSEDTIASAVERARQRLLENGILKKTQDAQLRKKLMKLCIKAIEKQELEDVVKEAEDILYALKFFPGRKEGFCFLVMEISDEYQMAINEEVCGYLEGHALVCNWSMLLSGIYMVQIDGDNSSFQEKLIELCRQIVQYLSPLMEIPMPYAVHYAEIHTPKKFLRCIQEIPLWREHFFYAGKKCVLEGDALRELPELDKETEQELGRIFELLEKKDMSFEESFAEFILDKKIKVDSLKRFSIKWIEDYYKRVQRNDGESLLNEIEETVQLEELTECILQLYQFELKYRTEIKNAVFLIQKEYQKRLVLAEVAERVGLSPHYFSRVFREETGKNFSEYLIQIRIEKAQELLKQGRFKVYEIAELVGIPNYRYFSTLFRKVAGYSPKQIGRKGGSNEDGSETRQI